MMYETISPMADICMSDREALMNQVAQALFIAGIMTMMAVAGGII